MVTATKGSDWTEDSAFTWSMVIRDCNEIRTTPFTCGEETSHAVGTSFCEVSSNWLMLLQMSNMCAFVEDPNACLRLANAVLTLGTAGARTICTDGSVTTGTAAGRTAASLASNASKTLPRQRHTRAALT
jgi:hypothetical protein